MDGRERMELEERTSVIFHKQQELARNKASEPFNNAITYVVCIGVMLVVAMLFVLFWTALFLISPGAALVASLATFTDVRSSPVSAWIWALVVSSAILVVLCAMFRDLRKTKNVYFATCCTLAAVYLAARLFDVTWAREHMSYFSSANDNAVSESSNPAAPPAPNDLVNNAAKQPGQSEVEQSVAPKGESSPAALQDKVEMATAISIEQKLTENGANSLPLHVPAQTVLPAVTTLSGEKVVAVKPSFDCEKAFGFVESRICAVPELASLDVELTRLYELKRQTDDPARKALRRAEQLEWLKRGRNSCTDEICLVTEYRQRIQALSN